MISTEERVLSKIDKDFEIGKKYREECSLLINERLGRVFSPYHLTRLHEVLVLQSGVVKGKCNNTYYNRLQRDVPLFKGMGLDYVLEGDVKGVKAFILFRSFADFGLYIKLPRGYYSSRQKAQEFLQFLYDFNAHVIFVLRGMGGMRFSDIVPLKTYIEFYGWKILTSKGNRNRLQVKVNPKRISYRGLEEPSRRLVYQPTVLEQFISLLDKEYD